MLRLVRTATLVTVAVATGCAGVIQRPDLSFDPAVADPAFAAGEGPVVLIDEAHFNYHTADGRYGPFAKLLRRDGYVVRSLRDPTTRAALDEAGG
jgi:hypothetical protein